MVKHLLSLLKRQRHPTHTGDADSERENTRIVNSVVQTLNRLLNPPLHHNLSSPSPRGYSSSSIFTHIITPESDDTSSPVRRRKNQPNTSTSSPRKGLDSKRQRNSAFSSATNREQNTTNSPSQHDTVIQEWDHHSKSDFGIFGKPTTEFDGWRRLWLDEICRITPGSVILLGIPPKRHRQKEDNAIHNRVVKRVKECVKCACPESFGFTTPFRDTAKMILLEKNAVTRNGETYLEFPAVIKHYPHREEYISQLLSVEDIERHIKQNGGLNITLLEYQSYKSLLVEWRDVPFIQFWVQRIRGESRPTPLLKERRALHQHAEDLSLIMDQVADDTLAMTELSVALEKARNRINNKTKSSPITTDYNLMIQTFRIQILQENEPSKLKSFVHNVNVAYEDAWVQVYSSFNSFGGGLLEGNVAFDINATIQEDFPMTYGTLEAIVFGPRADKTKEFYRLKRIALCNKFLALIRVRDPTYLPKWAMVCSLAMFCSGVAAKHVKNPMIGAYTVNRYYFLGQLNKLYMDTVASRRQLIQKQQYIHSSLDNYNQHHQVESRDGHGSIYHTGIVYNAVRAIAYRIPVGSHVRYHNVGENGVVSHDLYIVTDSSFIDPWSCSVDLRSPNGDIISTSMPQIGYEIVSIPGDPGKMDLVYLDQEEFLPRSVRQLMPAAVTDEELLLGKREWMRQPDYVASLPSVEVNEITPKKHYSMVQAMKRVQLIYRYIDWLSGTSPSIPMFDETTTSAIALLREMITEDNMLRDGILRKNVNEYQRDSLRHWNECYDEASEMILFPICPREEMTNEEAMLAAIQVMEDLGFIDKVGDDDYKLGPNAKLRHVFQYGDVLTIQKWYSLGYHILRKMTHIGREEYVSILMAAYDQFIKVHDYLHESIHRLDVIYKLYYGDIIQPIQYMIGTKKVGQKPSKGSWSRHENMIMKIHIALEKLFMESFMLNVGNEIIGSWDGDDLRGLLWQLQIEMESYAEELEECDDEISRCFALLMKYTSDWIIASKSIAIGDWCVNEVIGCKWISIWAASKKHGYLLESKRRIEAVFTLPWHVLEYCQMGRFVRLWDGNRFISFDDLCEKMNYLVKRCPKDSNFEAVCLNSRHLLAGQKCRAELFGKSSKGSKPSMEDDILKIHDLLKRVGVFQSHHEQREMKRDSIWKHITRRGKISPAKWHSAKEKVDNTSREKKALLLLFDKTTLPNVTRDEMDNADTTSSVDSSVHGDESESMAESVGSMSIDNYSAGTDASEFTTQEWENEAAGEIDDLLMSIGEFGVGENDVTDNEIRERARMMVMEDRENENTLEATKDQEDELKRTNTGRRDLNRACLKNQFEVGRKALKNVVRDREIERSKHERKMKLVYDSVDYFRKYQQQEMSNLEERGKKALEVGGSITERSWEQTIHTTMSTFNKDAYYSSYNN